MPIKSVYTHHIDLFASLKVSRGLYDINVRYIENRLSREDGGQATPYIYICYIAARMKLTISDGYILIHAFTSRAEYET